jgi:hypothetical protein
MASAWLLEEGPLVAAAYSDSPCTTVHPGTVPATVQSGSCSHSVSLLGLHFRVLAIVHSQVFCGFGCDAGKCSNCGVSGLGSLGQCVPLAAGSYAKVTAPPGPDDHDDEGIPIWAIMLIVAGAVAAVGAVVVFLGLAYRRFRAPGYRSLGA